MSYVNQKPCWDPGTTLGRNKAPKRIKTWTPWTPSSWKASPSHVTLRKQEGSCHHQTLAPNLPGRHSAEQRGKSQVSHSIPPATPGINQHSLLGTHTHKNWINNKLKTSTQQREWSAVSTPEKEGGGKELISMLTFSKQRLERQKGWKQVGDKLLPDIGQVVLCKVHLQNQWATSKVQQHCKIEKQTANHHNRLTGGGQLTDHWLCPRERGWGKGTSPQ
jgi:hypothetical protein